MTPKQAYLLLLTAVIVKRLVDVSSPGNLLGTTLQTAYEDMVLELEQIGVHIPAIDDGPRMG